MNYLKTVDQLTARLAMLEAQALVIQEEGAEPFSRLSAEIRSNYVWAIAEGVRECRELARQLPSSVAAIAPQT